MCWVEMAGDPSGIDRLAFEVRAFDWSVTELRGPATCRNTSYGDFILRFWQRLSGLPVT